MVALGVEVLGPLPASCRTTRLPVPASRGLEGLVGGKGADQVPHTPAAGAVFRAKGQEAGKTAVVFFIKGGACIHRFT